MSSNFLNPFEFVFPLACWPVIICKMWVRLCKSSLYCLVIKLELFKQLPSQRRYHFVSDTKNFSRSQVGAQLNFLLVLYNKKKSQSRFPTACCYLWSLSSAPLNFSLSRPTTSTKVNSRARNCPNGIDKPSAHKIAINKQIRQRR